MRTRAIVLPGLPSLCLQTNVTPPFAEELSPKEELVPLFVESAFLRVEKSRPLEKSPLPNWIFGLRVNEVFSLGE